MKRPQISLTNPTPSPQKECGFRAEAVFYHSARAVSHIRAHFSVIHASNGVESDWRLVNVVAGSFLHLAFCALILCKHAGMNIEIGDLAHKHIHMASDALTEDNGQFKRKHLQARFARLGVGRVRALQSPHFHPSRNAPPSLIYSFSNPSPHPR